MSETVQDINIPVTVGGVTFKNPFFVASGPTTKSVRQLVEIEKTGWAAASIKLSIDPAPYINRKPRYSLFKDRNALAFTAEKRLTFEQGLQLIKDAKPLLHDLKLMANITYAGDDGPSGWVNMAKKFEKAGADIIELNMCCPNMSYNVELTSGGKETGKKQTGASMGQHADIASEIVSAIKKEIKIPLFVKLTPEGGQIAHVAKALYDAGADAVGGTGNRLGMPPIDLENPGKAYYHLQDEISMGCHCGSWLKPLAQRDVYEIRKVCGMEKPVTAAGGITNWKDAVEMVLCGGTLLGVCAETLISGYDIVRPMIKGLKDYMDSHNYTSLSQMMGVIVPQVKTATDVTIYAGYASIKDQNLSGPCKSACPHHVPVQAYVQKVAKGQYREAFDLITSKNALQGICALVCPAPCEDACLRGSYDSPVKIRGIKRFVLDKAAKEGWKPSWVEAQSNGHKVAVIGSGASGLSCAAELHKAGFEVTVFEKENKLGGYLRSSIPSYMGHINVLDEEIETFKACGIKFVTSREVKDTSELKKMGFEAVYAATGYEKSEEASAIIEGKQKVNGSIVVVGSSVQAIDVARCALRSGAEKATVLSHCKFTHTFEKAAVQLAEQEGVTIIDNARMTSLTNNTVVAEIGNIEVPVVADKIIVIEDKVAELPEDSAKIMVVSLKTPVSVITAISAGKNAASEIDRAINGDKSIAKPIESVKTVNVEKVKERTGYIKKNSHYINLNSEPEIRLKSFESYERVLTEEEAVQEASRCLNCGCGEGCQLCKTICTDFAPFIADQDKMEIDKSHCVACGMCFNRCPNGNIEMINLGEKV